ncbi:MAG: MBL fold metallo-hydrolase [Ignavibacteria bacterium]|nr:MBL fold metallo-hydrolase [Ignavibacteria bacterium]
MVKVQRFECGPVLTNTYIVYNEPAGTCMVVDVPPDSLQQILQFVESISCKIVAILLTHTHWDHTADCSVLIEKTQAPVYVHGADDYRLTDPMQHTLWPLPFTIPSVKADHFVTHNQLLQIHPDLPELLVFHTPGHTEGGVCFVDKLHDWVFVGDTLFQRSIGRTDLPGGDMDVLLNSIQSSLLILPDNYEVFPGHGHPTTIGEERRFNPFLQQLS